MNLEREQPGYTKVYTLWDDARGVKNIQEATLNTADYGILQEHGLFGSREWWSAIDNGELAVHTVYGTICDLAMESMNDWPVFRILCDDGTVTESITRETLTTISISDNLYQIGRRVIWQYVHVRHKKRVAFLPERGRHTVSIWVASIEILFRPVGEEELSLIAASNFSAFAPRLPEQPIFYPVCSSRYAEEIASKWNTPRGYVTEFQVAKAFLAKYERHQVGGKEHVEYWIPAEDLSAFNRSIVGKIRVVKSFTGQRSATETR